MDEEKRLLAVWKQLRASPVWSAASGKQRNHDDLEQWLTSYRRALAKAAPGTLAVQQPRHT
jgi:hypothetical protein